MRATLPCLVLFLCLCGFGPPTLGDSEPFSPRLGTTELGAAQGMPVIPPSVRAVAAIVLDATDGHPLASRNADTRLAPASLTKMMTALVALDRAALTDSIVATERSRAEPTSIGLDPGDRLSLEDMLHGLILNSGNDAALAIAETVGGGSIERFVGWMNERAQLMGLYNTHFANPNGLDQAGHYSSARDMAEIARAFMAEPTLARIAGTRRHLVPGPPLYGFNNTNPLLGSYPGLDGAKTGFTDDAGRCFAASAVRDGRRIITVVLNSPNIAAESVVLLDFGFGQARPVALSPALQGYALLRENPVGSATVFHAVGWERPLLRAFTRRLDGGASEVTLKLLDRPVARWTS